MNKLMSYRLSRRGFLKASAGTTGALLLFDPLSIKPVSAASPSSQILTKKIGEKTTICCYCAVGCGAIVAAEGTKIVNLEGDPDHPINQGSLCSKGQAMAQIHTVNGEINPYRLTKPLYRAPGATEWQEKSWDWAVSTIAARVKETRDRTFKLTDPDSGGRTVNRTSAIASLGGGELDNEECYLLAKMNRALGVVYLEHCARI